MEKKWLGGFFVVLGLVLLVFAVGYSAGNSPTGYGIFGKLFGKTESTQSNTAVQSPTTPTQRTTPTSGVLSSDPRITQVAPNLFRGSRGMSSSELLQSISSNNVKMAEGTTCTSPEGECIFITEEGECIEPVGGCNVVNGNDGRRYCCTGGSFPLF